MQTHTVPSVHLRLRQLLPYFVYLDDVLHDCLQQTWQVIHPEINGNVSIMSQPTATDTSTA